MEAHRSFLMLAGEIVFLVALAVIADTGSRAARYVLLLLVILWIIYLSLHADQLQVAINKLGLKGGNV